MSRIATFLILAISLAACGVANTLVDGFKHAKAVEDDLATSIGMKPQVGFNWVNGRLVAVTVTFPQLYQDKPLGELAETVRRSVTAQFQQTPENILLAFALGRAPAGPATQLHDWARPQDAPSDHSAATRVAGSTASTLAAQNLNSGIFPNGSSFGLVSRFAAAST